MPNNSATIATPPTQALVCVSCGGELVERQKKWCARTKCQAAKARDRARVNREQVAKYRREQLKKEVAGRKCEGCGDELGPEYRRGAKYHGDPCGELARSRTAA